MDMVGMFQKKKKKVDFQEIEYYFDKVMPQTAKTHYRKEKNRQWKETNITVGSYYFLKEPVIENFILLLLFFIQ